MATMRKNLVTVVRNKALVGTKHQHSTKPYLLRTWCLAENPFAFSICRVTNLKHLSVFSGLSFFLIFPAVFMFFALFFSLGGGVLSLTQSHRDQGPGLLWISGDRWWLFERDKFTGLARKPSLALPGEESKAHKKMSHWSAAFQLLL